MMIRLIATAIAGASATLMMLAACGSTSVSADCATQCDDTKTACVKACTDDNCKTQCTTQFDDCTTACNVQVTVDGGK